MSVTLKDIARKAGVSISTVSRVINDDKEKPASDQTKNKIWKIVNQMGYSRNNNRVSTGSRKKIGVIANVSSEDVVYNPFTSVILDGVKSEIKAKGYSISFSLTKDELVNKSQIYKLFSEYSANGIIILGVYLKEDLLKKLTEKFKNIVLIKNTFNKIEADKIYVNKRKAVYEAIEYLIQLGHKKICFLGGMQPAKIFTSIKDGEKFKGYQKALEESDIEIDEKLIKNADYTLGGGYFKMKELLKSGNIPTAVFSASDLIGIGAMKAIQEQGFKIPEDISIISYDNIEISNYTNPPLTTIHVPKREMGEMAVKILLQRINGEYNLPFKSILPTKLVLRKSVGKA